MSDALNTTDASAIFQVGFERWKEDTRPVRGFSYLSQLCESPIELALGTALLFVKMPHDATADQVTPDVIAGNSNKDDVKRLLDCLAAAPVDPGAWLLPQAAIGPYRVDFLLAVKPNQEVFHFVIECDGHDYHERTKAQAQHDKAKDRFLTREGFTVIRFTGSEIYKDAASCAHEIYETVVARAYPEKAVAA